MHSENSHVWLSFVIYILLIYFLSLFILKREREHQAYEPGEGQREGSEGSKAGSMLWAASTEPNTWLKLTNGEIMTWAKVGHLTDWATQAPLLFILKERNQGH